MTTASEPIIVRLQLDPDSWHGSETEGVWVTLIQPVGEKAMVEIANIPFFSKQVSLGDTILAKWTDCGVVFDAIVGRSGHSTYRIFVGSPGVESTKALQVLDAKECCRESTSLHGGMLYAIDIPPDVDIYEIYDILEDGQKQGYWLFEEGYVGHPLRGGSVPLQS